MVSAGLLDEMLAGLDGPVRQLYLDFFGLLCQRDLAPAEVRFRLRSLERRSLRVFREKQQPLAAETKKAQSLFLERAAFSVRLTARGNSSACSRVELFPSAWIGSYIGCLYFSPLKVVYHILLLARHLGARPKAQGMSAGVANVRPEMGLFGALPAELLDHVMARSALEVDDFSVWSQLNRTFRALGPFFSMRKHLLPQELLDLAMLSFGAVFDPGQSFGLHMAIRNGQGIFANLDWALRQELLAGYVLHFCGDTLYSRPIGPTVSLVLPEIFAACPSLSCSALARLLATPDSTTLLLRELAGSVRQAASPPALFCQQLLQQDQLHRHALDNKSVGRALIFLVSACQKRHLLAHDACPLGMSKKCPCMSPDKRF